MFIIIQVQIAIINNHGNMMHGRYEIMFQISNSRVYSSQGLLISVDVVTKFMPLGLGSSNGSNSWGLLVALGTGLCSLLFLLAEVQTIVLADFCYYYVKRE